MKKILTLTIVLAMLLPAQTIFAVTYNYSDISTEVLPDGSRFVTIIETVPQNTVQPATEKTVTKTKTTYYKNAADEVMWYVRVKGTFTYGNGSAKCISSTPSAASQNSTWKVSGISGSKTGNRCSASATGKHYKNNVVLESLKRTVTLTCSPTGQFS